MTRIPSEDRDYERWAGELFQFPPVQAHDWVGDPWEFMVDLKGKTRGMIGEQIAERMLADSHLTVLPRDGAGHDVIADGIKIEIKYSMLSRSNEYKWLQIRPTDDYDMLMLLGHRPGRFDVWMTTTDVVLPHSTPQHRSEECYHMTYRRPKVNASGRKARPADTFLGQPTNWGLDLLYRIRMLRDGTSPADA